MQFHNAWADGHMHAGGADYHIIGGVGLVLVRGGWADAGLERPCVLGQAG